MGFFDKFKVPPNAPAKKQTLIPPITPPQVKLNYTLPAPNTLIDSIYDLIKPGTETIDKYGEPYDGKRIHEFLWDAHLFQFILLCNKPVALAVHECAKNNFDRSGYGPIRKELFNLYKTEYLNAWKQGYYEENNYRHNVDLDILYDSTTEQKARLCFFNSLNLICSWCLQDYCLNPGDWSRYIPAPAVVIKPKTQNTTRENRGLSSLKCKSPQEMLDERVIKNLKGMSKGVKIKDTFDDFVYEEEYEEEYEVEEWGEK